MGDAAALAASLLLPWLAGWACVIAGAGGTDLRWQVAAGYGYFVGLLLVTFTLRAQDAAGVRFGFAWTAFTLVLVAAAAAWLAYRARGLRAADRARERAALLPYARIAFVVLVALTVVRIALLGIEALTSPLLPLDTWSQWATKARVWFEYRALVPFVDEGAWLQRPGSMHFTDSHPAYPATLPLLQVWSALALGRWDESLVNVAWPGALAALGLAFYGQVRRVGVAALPAMFGTYALLSLPFVDLYVALAGLADLFVGASFGLAAASLWLWTLERRRSDLVLAVAMALLCALTKREGLLWDLTLVPALLAMRDRRLAYGAFALGAAAFALYLLFGPERLRVAEFIILGDFHNVLPYVYEHFFVMDNWHLFWYATVAVIAANWRSLLRPTIAPASLSVLAGALFVLLVYCFTTAWVGVAEESLTNRMPLQMVPAVAIYLAMVLAQRTRERALVPAQSAA